MKENTQWEDSDDSISLVSSVEEERDPLTEYMQKNNINETITEEEFYSTSASIFTHYIEHPMDKYDLVNKYIDLLYTYPLYTPYIPLWELCNILFFTQHDPTELREQLRQWLNDLQPTHDVYGHLLRGNYEEAMCLLAEDDNKEVYRVIIDQLEHVHKQTGRVYIEQWTEWHENTVIRLKNMNTPVALILTGDEDTMFKYNYLDAIIGTMIYSRPTMNVHSLAEYTSMRGYAEEEDQLYVYMMMGLIEEALSHIHNEWLQTHLGHALITKEEPEDPIYYTLQSYASHIAHQYQMWTQAVVYLSACPQKETWIIELLTESCLIHKDMDDLRSLVKIATRYQLKEVERHMRRMIGHKQEEEGEMQAAAVQYSKAEDTEGLDRLADVLFKKYLEEKTLEEVVINNSMRISDHYSALIDYTQFRQSLKTQPKEAVRHVLRLFKSTSLPPHFECVLLIDILGLLEENTSYFKAGELVQFIKIFENSIKDKGGDYMAHYYQLHHTPLPTQTVIAKLRERIAYKAAITTQ